MTATLTAHVSGMTCQHCVAHVTEELTALPAVSDVSVDLAPEGVSTVHISATGDVSDSQIREAVDEAGDYTVESIDRA